MTVSSGVPDSSLRWEPLHFTNDKMKDVDDVEAGFLRKYCEWFSVEQN